MTIMLISYMTIMTYVQVVIFCVWLPPALGPKIDRWAEPPDRLAKREQAWRSLSICIIVFCDKHTQKHQGVVKSFLRNVWECLNTEVSPHAEFWGKAFNDVSGKSPLFVHSLIGRHIPKRYRRSFSGSVSSWSPTFGHRQDIAAGRT